VNDESDEQKLACSDIEKRVKNDQKTGVQKGSKMAKNGGPKKGQKRAENRLFGSDKKNMIRCNHQRAAKKKKMAPAL
jgi:hypothetical protein